MSVFVSLGWGGGLVWFIWVGGGRSGVGGFLVGFLVRESNLGQ